MLMEQRFARFRTPAVIGFVCIFGYLYFQILHRIIQQQHQADFYHFYTATVAMSHGEDIYLSGTRGYVYPPLLAFLLLPLAHLSSVSATAIFLTVTVPLMIAAILVAARDAQSRLINPSDDPAISPSLLALTAFLTSLITFGRLKAELTILQTDVIVLSMYIFAHHWIDRRPAWAGWALGLAMNIKYYTLPGFFYLLLRRRWTAASCFIVSAIFFALLPALRVGLHTDLQYMSIASGGVLKSVGVQTGQIESAHVHRIDESLSLSITSGLARIFRKSHPGVVMPLTGLIMLLFVVIAAVWYHRKKLPLFAWPRKSLQLAQPYSQLIPLEWAGIMIASVAFSPDSNMRHMVLVLFANAIGLTLLLAGQDRAAKIPLTVAFLFQWYCLDLIGKLTPPLRDPFFYVGGHGWALMIFYGVVLWAGLRELSLPRSAAAESIGAVPSTSA